ncbi:MULTISPECIES: DUF4406 domain-containing protein [unclassified Pseudomonas]|uniref:DUF4406 domain-containing protein n=1 Tax=unclassified Pseudomonas TaxID=196821 RepID=UPI000A1E30F4|nr:MULTISPECIES: DUF4406 domain-containing protein [unclassified Pseudomonas]
MPKVNRKVIYLSGPMTNMLDLNFLLFHSTAASLRAAGHSVINPAELNPDPDTWSKCMRRDIAALMECDTVATLPGWQNSRGASLEVHIGKELGMKVVNAHDLVSMEIAGCAK